MKPSYLEEMEALLQSLTKKKTNSDDSSALYDVIGRLSRAISDARMKTAYFENVNRYFNDHGYRLEKEELKDMAEALKDINELSKDERIMVGNMLRGWSWTIIKQQELFDEYMRYWNTQIFTIQFAIKQISKRKDSLIDKCLYGLIEFFKPFDDIYFSFNKVDLEKLKIPHSQFKELVGLKDHYDNLYNEFHELSRSWKRELEGPEFSR